MGAASPVVSRCGMAHLWALPWRWVGPSVIAPCPGRASLGVRSCGTAPALPGGQRERGQEALRWASRSHKNQAGPKRTGMFQGSWERTGCGLQCRRLSGKSSPQLGLGGCGRFGGGVGWQELGTAVVPVVDHYVQQWGFSRRSRAGLQRWHTARHGALGSQLEAAPRLGDTAQARAIRRKACPEPGGSWLTWSEGRGCLVGRNED